MPDEDDEDIVGGATVAPVAIDSDELCLVCSDASTGYHYGVPSCNGCKTFFRRTIMKKQTFVCQYNANCPVDKGIRCACRHCRFEKCLRVGMDRKAIQQNRDPIGYTKRTRRYPQVSQQSSSSIIKPIAVDMTLTSDMTDHMVPTPPSITVSSHQQHYHRAGAIDTSSPEQRREDDLLDELVRTEKLCQRLRPTQMVLKNSLLGAVHEPCLLADQSFLDLQLRMPSHSYESLHPAVKEDYQYWHERDWRLMIEWAKTIDTYQKLPIGDRLALLRYSVFTYPSLVQCFYSPNKGPDTIVFPNGAFFDRHSDPLNRPGGFQKRKYQMLDQMLNPMRKMSIDMAEFAAFKAIFFLNPDADDVGSPSKSYISETRYAITNALYRYMLRTKPDEAADRFGRLLLMGTVLATMAVEMKETVVIADFFGQIHFSPFARELLFGVNYKQEEMVAEDENETLTGDDQSKNQRPTASSSTSIT